MQSSFLHANAQLATHNWWPGKVLGEQHIFSLFGCRHLVLSLEYPSLLLLLLPLFFPLPASLAVPVFFYLLFTFLQPNNQPSSYPLSSDRRRLVVAIRSCSVSFRIVDIRILRRRYSQLSYRFVVKLPVSPRRIVYKLNAPRIIPRLTDQSASS
jgi:hypothetical protein